MEFELTVSTFKSRQDAMDKANYELSFLQSRNSRCKLLMQEPFVVSSAVAYCNQFFQNAPNIVLSVCVPETPLSESIIQLCDAHKI